MQSGHGAGLQQTIFQVQLEDVVWRPVLSPKASDDAAGIDQGSLDYSGLLQGLMQVLAYVLYAG